jgi:DNA-binding NtrC family response regulator
MTPTKLMLIDDEAPFVTAMQRRIAKRDIAIVTACSGQEGLKKLAETPEIEVVVLDVKMPGMDGIQTLREIKRAYPLTEVILLTGHATFRSAIEGMQLGAFDYLMKPCDLEELLTRVEEAKTKRLGRMEKIRESTGEKFSSSRDA